MKKYLSGTIIEQINRAMCLKKLISKPHPSELSALAERCRTKINNIVDKLKNLQDILESRSEDDIRDITRSFRRLIWEVKLPGRYVRSLF